MFAGMARGLNQRIDDIEEWEAEKIFRYFDRLVKLTEDHGGAP